jgi:hypothetical protein
MVPKVESVYVKALLPALAVLTALTSNVVESQHDPHKRLIQTPIGISGPQDSPPPPNALEKRVYSDWNPTREMNNQATVAVAISSDGTFYDVHIGVSSDDPQLDADCLQAVMGASGTQPTRIEDGSLWHTGFAFNKTTKTDHLTSGTAAFLEQHPELRNKCIAFYRIPFDIMHRYPGLFTESELTADENVGFLDAEDPQLKDWTVDKLRAIYQSDWAKFFRDHPVATKVQILQERSQLRSDDRRLHRMP